ncbi:MAG TPA: T9SS type A sorting domain-containing protein, partial [Fermentimonas sp.]|nr:T9SS type A sorting domain-containing protein [Fermentimonas sp.]
PDWLSNHEFTIETPQVSVYPNPATTILHVQLPNSVKKAELSISDINGKVVKSQTLNSNSVVQLAIEDLEKGVYILKVVSKDNQWQKKLVKR